MKRALEYLPHHRSRGRVNLQRGTLLHPVADLDADVAEGGLGAEEEAAGGRLPHTPDDVLGKIFAVEFVHALDDRFHELAGGGVVGVLGDGYDPYPLSPEHGLEGDGVLPLPGEPRKLPDEDDLKWGLWLATFLDHLLELGPVGARQWMWG